jgi:methyl-accepting chemotaxis protein
MDLDQFDQEVTAAKEAHFAWRERLAKAIRFRACETPIEHIACDDRCAFGKWLHSESLDGQTKDGKPYQVTKRLHAEFHTVASEVAKLAENGDTRAAYSLLDGEFDWRSRKLTVALEKWTREVHEK